MDWTIAASIGAMGLLITIMGLVAGWAIRINRGERADSAATKAHGRIDTLATMLSDFKQEVAREYASVRMVEQMEGRIVLAIERLGDRLDRVFEGRKP